MLIDANGRFSKKLPQDIQRIAERKLILIHRSFTLNDLRVPPSNHLEALKGNRKGQHGGQGFSNGVNGRFLPKIPNAAPLSLALSWLK
ncbi:MAG: hypothetical protein M5U34_02185 [Chloroflexi bacterium]|nr:hypothetical protein [Chloroflexota bacterium]